MALLWSGVQAVVACGEIFLCCLLPSYAIRWGIFSRMYMHDSETKLQFLHVQTEYKHAIFFGPDVFEKVHKWRERMDGYAQLLPRLLFALEEEML